MDDPNFQPNSQPNQPIWMPGMFDNHTFYPSGFEGNDAFSASVGFVNSAFSVVMSNFSMSHHFGFPPYYPSAASFSTSFVHNVPLNAGHSYPHPIVSTFSSIGLHSQQFSSPVFGVMFNTGIASNSALQFLPSYVNPPERAEMLTNTHKEEAVVFVNAQEKERVRCSVCWQYGGVRGEYFSPNGSGNLSLSGFQAHLSSDFHVKSLLAKEKGKQTLETVVTSQNSDLGGASEHGSVTAVSSMEKVSTSVEEIKGVLNEKL
ncbi:uncharacterized protein LOC121741119 isoform X3 [Salvia splendens]|uniref:uncharacterized protein LOC121741119 isoform X2 n=1 Tax=Salvia splendens TaxID=180675 RepID=UPI001C264AFA|nr:uncharacterized protein LOC121741119 isoform X2 [Salvia splendens]XP_041989753.1 uncharacterized protein LOC121741119 isoform X3 [Salvia splendens]